MKRGLCLALGLIAGAAVAADDLAPPGASIDPGLWEVTATVDSGTATKPAPTIARHCLTPEDAAKGPLALLLMSRTDCSFTRSSIAGGKLDAMLSCAPGAPKAMTVAITGSFSPKSYEAVSNIVMSGGTAMTVTATAKWIGACSN